MSYKHRQRATEPTQWISMATLAKKYCFIVFQVLNETSTSLCRLSADEAYAHNPLVSAITGETRKCTAKAKGNPLVSAIIGETSKCPAKAKAKSVLLPDL